MMTSQKTTRTMNSQCEPRELAIDIESYSSIELKDCGAYKYAASPDFEILLIAYKFSDEDDVKLIDCREELIEGVDLAFAHPEFYDALVDPAIIKTAYNANFERTCFAAWLQEEMPATQWLDTMVLAASLGLPRSLAAVGDALGLGEDEAKLRTGKALINYFCKPCRPTKVNGGCTRNYPKDAPEKWEQFKTYNVQDVVTEQAILQRLKQWRPDASENALWALDQKINDRGVRLDIPMAEVVVEHDTELRDRLKQRAVVVSGLDNPNSLQQLTGWLDSYGIHVDSLAKDTVARLLSQELPAPVREVLTIRQSLGKTSVKKYQTMINMAGTDDRARGTLMFYGGHTGRFSGKGLQPQNLSKNEMPDAELDLAHDLVKAGDFESVEMIWGAGTTSDILSQLVRTAFIPSEGCRFVVSDFSAIEARVIAWLAGEQWRLDVFENGGDIYCASASQMFGVPVEKNGVNGHMRKQGKIAELACIAEGSLVLTDRGEVPIEQVTTEMKVWDGAEWVSHEGVVYRGQKEVITYEGLTGTPDHVVFVEGSPKPVHLGEAAKSGAHLLRPQINRKAVRSRQNHRCREKMELSAKPLLRPYGMRDMRKNRMAELQQPSNRSLKRVSDLFTATADTSLVRSSFDGSKATLRKPERSWVSQLWCSWNPFRISICLRSWPLLDQYVWPSRPGNGNRQDRQQRELRTWEPAFCNAQGELREPPNNDSDRIRPEVLALCGEHRSPETGSGKDSRRDHRGSRTCGQRKTEELADHKRTTRVYDIRNAGPRHRYTVQGYLVHNCGYGGSIGAIDNFDRKGDIPEEDRPKIIKDWRAASPHIVQLWSDLEKAAIRCVRTRMPVELPQYYGIRFRFERAHGYNVLFIDLPNGRPIAYWDPKIKTNKFDKSALSFMHVATGKWVRGDTFGGRLTENIIQAIARDCLAEKMKTLDEFGYDIAFHVHDEVILDVPTEDTGAAALVDQIMGEPISWAPGLPLKGGTYECIYYRKD